MTHVDGLSTLDPGSDFAGEFLRPDDDGYEEARTIFNPRVARRPAAIARCATITDVQAALRLARETGLPLAVRSGGHSIAGWSSIEGGLVVDLSLMRSIQVDREARRAWVGPGARAFELVAQAAKYGLAAVTGVVPTIGLGGLLLGLGEGYLSPKYGYGTDSIEELEVVTATGDVLRVDAGSHPDLFWAIRGAGANFGVVTAMRLRLYPIPEQAVGGWIWFGPEDLEAVTDHVWDIMRDGSPHWFPLVFYAVDETSTPKLGIIPGHTGPADEAERDMARLRACGTPTSDDTRSMSYVELIGGPDGETLPPRRYVWDLHLFPFDGNAALQKDVLLAEQRRLPDQWAVIDLWRTADVEPAAGSAAPRRPGISVHLSNTWEDPADDDARVAWCDATGDALVRSGTVAPAPNTLNHASTMDVERTRRMYGTQTFDRLSALKAVYDPENVFRSNCNIPPA